MNSFKPIELNKRVIPWKPILLIAGVLILVGGFFAYRYLLSPNSQRWASYWPFHQNPGILGDAYIPAGTRCGDAPFAFPIDGAIFGLWGQSYRPGHIHAGLDIFPGTDPGVTPIYAVYPGYLTRHSDWTSTVIVRIPDDPLNPGRQIWTYYTHMANEAGSVSYISSEFPPGTSEVYVEAGTILGYVGNYSGNPDNPTGLHLHISIVRDDGQGSFLNELEIRNTYDPTPYFNLAVNQADNPQEFPRCEEESTQEYW